MRLNWVMIGCILLTAEIGLGKNSAIDEILSGYITSLEENLQKAGDKKSVFPTRLSALKEAAFSLNNIRRYGYETDYPGFINAGNNLALQLKLAEANIQPILNQPAPTKEDLTTLEQYAYVYWFFHTGHYSIQPDLSVPKESLFSFCRQIDKKIADLTKFESVKNDIPLCELGLKSRKWLAVYQLQEGPYDLKSQNETLSPLKQYIDHLLETPNQSQTIEEEIWDSRNLECEILYAVGDYDGCIQSVDRYFGEMLKNLTPESPESPATRAALTGLDFRIQSIATPIRPDIFDYRLLMQMFRENKERYKDAFAYLNDRDALAKQYKFSPVGRARLLAALEEAKRLASFGDRHSSPNEPMDMTKKRWQLVFSLYEALDQKKEKELAQISLYKKDPRRFKEYGSMVQNAEIRKMIDKTKSQKGVVKGFVNVQIGLLLIFTLIFLFLSIHNRWQTEKKRG